MATRDTKPNRVQTWKVMVALAITLLLVIPGIIFAQNSDRSVDQLQEQIEKQNERIEEINQEIDKYESELADTRDQKNTLQNTLTSLNNSIKRLQLRIEKTTRQIDSVESRIAKLNQQLKNTRQDIETARQSLAEGLKAIHRAEHRSLVETLFTAESLSQALKTTDQLTQIQASIQSRLQKIRDLRQTQEKQKQQAQDRQERLAGLQSQLQSQRSALQTQKQEKRQLLAQTDRQEEEYQNLLARKRQQKEEFEKQLQTFESRLESAVADDQVPDSNDASFQWPVPNVHITQQFGGTEFAQRNPSAYGRPFHNGTDFGADVGTPIQPTLAGTVRATGNTDDVSGCYSYGKWILVDHDEVSTLYAHLSDINAAEGQSVDTDTTIGYVGNTGYSTGPHLHLTTYIKDDVRITRLGDVKDETNCGAASIPVAPQNGYLNPMKFLP